MSMGVRSPFDRRLRSIAINPPSAIAAISRTTACSNRIASCSAEPAFTGSGIARHPPAASRSIARLHDARPTHDPTHGFATGFAAWAR